MMWRDVDQYGNLTYQFIDTVKVLIPYYNIRGVGGLMYFTDLLFLLTIFMTITAGKKLEREPNYATPMFR